MAKLKMLEEEGNKLVNIAHTMVAKDGEVRKKLFRIFSWLPLVVTSMSIF